MEILNTDLILVDHNGELAKFEPADLSSYFATKNNIEEVSQELDRMLDTIIELSVSFGSTHYTKSEIKSTYATVLECQTVIDNSNYTSEDEITAEMKKYIKESDINAAVKEAKEEIDRNAVKSNGTNGVWQEMAEGMIEAATKA